ncbi:efflux RND transporter periplasmic adaptor subunit [Maribellus maritimus]|uniref:efflux RND transporter periplasmic adaptor subunit n=1 Tax=Maribellus maritimus TaxID=2870838 RepID=UPI001EEBEA93|nr:efflux RND transporter periplasmic adaptor subunit [Maribellus maritimus]MCG6188523.1 efflux RND transporter periplasmic adaptor subunit [Maribellus maritimus]
MKKRTIFIIAILAAASAIAFMALKPKKVNADKINIETAKAETGSVSKTVTATGTLEAISTVEVGTQVSGIIENIYVDFNSYVKRNQVIAQIDTTNLVAQLEQSQATLDNAKAELDYQQANYNRLAPLNDKKLISQSDFDQTVYNLNKAKANYNSAIASHRRNQINLNYAFIHSPIDGIVLNRAVEEGQTVAASFNTPTLFTIANDLTQMRVEADVDEADIGQVKEGQRVEFTVDAFPDDVFEGEVTEVRLEPTVTNNVVTYTIIISAPNPDFKLMPGMTAETEIYVQERKDILVVPSKALRFNPDQKLLLSYMSARPKPDGPEGGQIPESNANKQVTGNAQANQGNVVWVKKDSVIRPIPVKTGMDDDINVEILAGINPGDEVILDMEETGKIASAPTAGGNPFMPGPPGRR